MSPATVSLVCAIVSAVCTCVCLASILLRRLLRLPIGIGLWLLFAGVGVTVLNVAVYLWLGGVIR